jgi:hypothetical protein
MDEDKSVHSPWLAEESHPNPWKSRMKLAPLAERDRFAYTGQPEA